MECLTLFHGNWADFYMKSIFTFENMHYSFIFVSAVHMMNMYSNLICSYYSIKNLNMILKNPITCVCNAYVIYVTLYCARMRIMDHIQLTCFVLVKCGVISAADVIKWQYMIMNMVDLSYIMHDEYRSVLQDILNTTTATAKYAISQSQTSQIFWLEFPST